MILVSSTLLLSGCFKSKYQRTLDRQLASGERYDSVFMGIHLNMSSKDFYEYCWELNKQQLFLAGPANASVEYNFELDGKPVKVYFYPEFHNDSIYQLPFNFSYTAWAPWNKELFASELLPEIVELLEEWHGPGFFEVDHPEKGSVWVKIDGNRRIVVSEKDDTYVQVIFTDMSVKKEEGEEVEPEGLVQ